MDLINFIRVLSKRKLILIIVPIITIVVSYFLTRNLPEIYSSEAQISTGITDGTNINFSSKETAEKDSEIKQKFSNLIELMKSKKIIDLVSYRLILHDLTSEKPFRPLSKLLLEMTPDARQYAVSTFTTKLDSVATLKYEDPREYGLIKILESMRYDDDAISGKLKITRVENSDYISLKSETENAELCAFIVNSHCEEFIKYYKDKFKLRQYETRDFWSKLVEQKKKELDDKIEVLKDYKIKNRVINLYEQTKSIDNQIAGMEVRREEVNKTIPGFKAALTDINSRLTDSDKRFFEFGVSPINKDIIYLKEKLKYLNERLINSGLEDSNVQDSIIKTRMLLEGKIKDAANEYLVNPNAPKQELVMRKLGYEIELDLAENQVKSIDKDIERLKKKFDIYTPLEGTIQAYERDVDVASRVYLELLTRLNDANLSTNLETKLSQSQIGIPGPPQASKKMLIIILSGLISFVLCIVIIFILEYIDLTIKTPKKFRQLTGLSVIGYLNYLKDKTLDLKQIFSINETSVENDTFKHLLRNLRFEIDNKMNGKKILLFTSTSEKEGKSFCIISLSYSLALIGKKVLIIDSNFRNNTITKNFDSQPLLGSFFNGSITGKEAVTVSSIKGIDTIGCKHSYNSPFEVAKRNLDIDIFDEFINLYDYIFIEGPSLNRYSGSKELERISDKIIGVFSASKVLEEPDKLSIEYMKGLKEKFIGAVLNNLTLENLEQIYGETDKKRSGLRRFVKRILKRRLSADKSNGKEKVIIK
jgi:polysaccharide biosynthesis transport protein